MSGSATRSAWSCESCRRRKVRCDGGDPCSHCKRRDDPCVWPENARLTARPITEASSQQSSPGRLHSDLATRVTRIESALKSAGILELPVVNAPAEQLHDPPTSGSRGQQDVSILHLVDASHGRPLQQDVHLHDDFDHHIIGASPEEHQRQPQTATGDPRPQYTAVSDAKTVLFGVLPEKTACDRLVRSYFRHVEWIHHTLDEPKFMTEYNLFWMQYARSDFAGESQWLALLMIILCLGSHFDPRTSSSTAAEKMYAATHELLRISDYRENHSVTVVQVLMLMGLWLNDRGHGKTHHIQLASAIRMAINLGLSKFDADEKPTVMFPREDIDFFAVPRLTPDCIRSPTYEVSRRLWWSLVCQDYYTASSCNFTYTIHPRQCRTHLFLNMDESDLLFSNDVADASTGYPLNEVATSASYHLLKIPFTLVAKAMVDLYNDDDFSYASVLKLDSVLWATYNNLPSFFKWRTAGDLEVIPSRNIRHPEHLGWQRLFLGFTVHNRVLRLHRPFMVRGYINETMAYSKKSTLDSALACLELAEYGRETEFPGLRWWVILIHIFTSGVALCIDLHFLLQQRNLHAARRASILQIDQSISGRREQIERIIRLLRPAAKSSVAAARGITAIEGLIGQAERSNIQSSDESSHGSPSRKRQRNDEDVTAQQHTFHQQSTQGSYTQIDHYPSSTADQLGGPWLEDLSVGDWTGPDWDELFLSLAHDGQQPTTEPSADLFEAMNSFANGYS